jgi:transposase
MFELTDQAFGRVQPLLPVNSRRGKPWRDHRQVLGGIIWKLHTSRPWRDVPTRFGPWQTCYGRLRRWQADGTWPRIWALLAADQAAQATIAPASSARRWVRRRSDSGAREPDGGDATTTTTTPAGRWVGSTTPARPAAAAPPRSRPGPGPSRVAVAVLRAQLPLMPTGRPLAVWARTAARNAWATRTKVVCRYQASKRPTWSASMCSARPPTPSPPTSPRSQVRHRPTPSASAKSPGSPPDSATAASAWLFT